MTAIERGQVAPAKYVAPPARKGWADKDTSAKRCIAAGLNSRAVSKWRHRHADTTTPDEEVIEIILSNKRRGGQQPWKLSRYHVAKLMEMRYGLGWSLRDMARHTGLSPSGIWRAIKSAEAGNEFPEVTPVFIPVEVAA